MNFERARYNMVEQQVRPWDVLDFDVLDLLMEVRREEYVPPAMKSLALSEAEIQLGHGATMFTPVLEGKVLQALQVRRGEQVLEIGTGSGYFTALLAARAEWVRSIEIEPELVRFASDNLKRNGVENVVVEDGDGSLGWPSRAPYDLIVVSGGLPVLPHSMLEQLKVGGRLFAFVGEAPLMRARLVTCTAEGEFRTEDLFETLVPQLRNAPQRDQFEF
ncbi:MAG: protein-L-isoaspartate O-methyltransferase [Rhodocyclaceae bacterium]|nr:protein-L-isoaspartate O-methyltransferase [Rhodocyclaceae bacterium]